jgi:hypothetical protein
MIGDIGTLEDAIAKLFFGTLHLLRCESERGPYDFRDFSFFLFDLLLIILDFGSRVIFGDIEGLSWNEWVQPMKSFEHRSLTCFILAD